jgi:Putative MetA-pathway of phenol degradation
MRKRAWLIATCAVALVGPAMAGPPYLSDDPQPTPYKHYEIYTFDQGTNAVDGTTGSAGVDLNYGGAPDLQLTATVGAGFSAPSVGRFNAGLANTQLAAKYRFLHADTFGWDVALFPRVFLPSSSKSFGATDLAVLIPIWVQRDLGAGLTVFGGGGCQFFAGGAAQNFCETGWVTTYEVTKGLTLGGEVFHQTANSVAPAQTSLGVGLTYDVDDTYHLLGYVNRGIENADATNRVSWYTALLFTF